MDGQSSGMWNITPQEHLLLFILYFHFLVFHTCDNLKQKSSRWDRTVEGRYLTKAAVSTFRLYASTATDVLVAFWFCVHEGGNIRHEISDYNSTTKWIFKIPKLFYPSVRFQWRNGIRKGVSWVYWLGKQLVTYCGRSHNVLESLKQLGNVSVYSTCRFV